MFILQKWNDELAKIAQRWADQCTFGHDSKRETLDKTYIGQNVYTGSSTVQLSKEDVSKIRIIIALSNTYNSS